MNTTVLSMFVALLLLLCPGLAGASHGPASITVLAVDPVTPTTLYAGTSDRGLLKSFDGGTTWGPTGLSGSVAALAIDPVVPDSLYAGTDQGVAKSSDGGTAWTATGLNGMVQILVVNPVATSTVYAVLAGTGAFMSGNGGASWSLLGPAGTVVRALALDHATPTTLYVGGEGVYRSVDGGTSWVPIGLAGHTVSALGSYGGALYAVSQYGAFRQVAGTWTQADRIPSLMDPQTPTTLYASSVSGAFKSVDDGATWTPANIGLTDVLLAQGASMAVGPLAIDRTTPETLYAATEVGVFRSQDGAATWQHPVAEDCFNGADDDFDGAIDGNDSDCPLTCLTGEFCPPGYSCNPNGYCEPHCGNGFKDGDEGDVDCGGLSCAACVNGQTCWVDADCQSGICENGTICVAATALSALNVDPATVVGGNPTGAVVTLSTAAPSGGELVTLSVSDTNAATMPSTVTVPAGATTVSFIVTTNSVSASTTVTIFATAGGATRSAQLTVTPAVTVAALTLDPASVPGGASSTATVTLSAPAPAAGMLVTLASESTAAASVPGSVTVTAGATMGTFTVSTSPAAASITVAVSASAGGVTRSAQLTVTPTLTLSALNLNPTTVRGGKSATGTVILSAPAPSGGTVVPLSSNKPTVASVPSTVTVPAGATSATFTVSTRRVKSSTVVAIAAQLGGVTQSAALTVTR